MTAALLRGPRRRRRRLPLAARRPLGRAHADPRRGGRARGPGRARSRRVARAAEGVNRSLEEGDAVTQFEAATAATFVALATRAGQGGGDRGRARRPPRRDQHDPLAGHRADLDRPRPHRVAGGDRAGDRRREAGGAARPDDAGPRPGLAGGRRARRAHGRRARRPPGACAGGPGTGAAPARPRRLPAPQLRPRPRRRRGLPRRARPPGWSPRSRPASSSPAVWSGSPSSRRPTSTPPTTPTASPPWPRRCRTWSASGRGRRLPGDPRRQGRGGDGREAWRRCSSGPSAPRSRRRRCRRTAAPARARGRRRSWPRCARQAGLAAAAEPDFETALGARPRPGRRAARGRPARRRLPLRHRAGPRAAPDPIDGGPVQPGMPT